MTSTTLPLIWIDVDFQIDSGGEVYRAKSITYDETYARLDQDQMGQNTVDHQPGSLVREWIITIDEVSGNFSTFQTWNGGTVTHDLKISKDTATLTLTNCKLFNVSNPMSAGSSNQISLTGVCDGASEA